MRAGTRTIGMLSDEMQVRILRTMAGGFDALTVRRRGPSEVAQAALPAELPPEANSQYTISPAGRARLPVANAIEYWLLDAPGGELAYEDRRAKEAIMALSAAWDQGVPHHLARGPLDAEGFAEEAGIGLRKARSLLRDMRRVKLLEVSGGEGEAVVYQPTEWLRRSVAPLACAARVERSDPPEGALPIDALDVETAFLLAAPLADVPGMLSGTCRLAVDLGGGSAPAGITATVRDGVVIACEPSLEIETSNEAGGEIRAWFRALEGRYKRLEYSGNSRFARALVEAIATGLVAGGGDRADV